MTQVKTRVQRSTPVPAAPPGPPRLPIVRRIGRFLLAFVPILVWGGALAAAVLLYANEAGRGQALAYEDILEVRVTPAIAGRVSTLSVVAGQEVAKGDLVATLDAADLDARLRLARVMLERTRTRIDAVRTEIQIEFQDRTAQAVSRRASYETEGRRIRDELAGLAAADASDRAEVAALAPQIERLSPLVERGLVTADRLEGVIQKRSVLQQRLTTRAEQRKAARGELEAWRVRVPSAPTEPDVATRLLPFELEFEAQEARVAELELERAKCRIHAPASGRVNRISLRPGEWCAAGDEIAEIVVPRPNRMTAYVVDHDIREIAPGTRADLFARDGLGASLTGTVVMVGPRIEQVPRRLRMVPSLPTWGRLVAIEVEMSTEAIPGNIYHVRFDR